MSLEALIAKLALKLPDSWKLKLAGGKPLTIRGQTLDLNLQLILHGARRKPPIWELSAHDAWQGSEDSLAVIAPRPEAGVLFEDQTISLSDGYDLPIRVYRPDDQDPSRAALTYLHMGGGVLGSLETCHVFCSILSKTLKTAIVSVDYRLAPEHQFPIGLEDSLAAYEWTLKNSERLGGKAGHAMIGGDSIGGNFAAVICQEARRRAIPMPDAQLLIYPVTDMVTHFASHDDYKSVPPLTLEAMEWMMGHYLPEGQAPDDLRLSPALETRLEDLPPALIATAGFDTLRDDAEAYAHKLKAAGVSVEFICYASLCHAFTAMTGASKTADDACRDIANRFEVLLDSA